MSLTGKAPLALTRGAFVGCVLRDQLDVVWGGVSLHNVSYGTSRGL